MCSRWSHTEGQITCLPSAHSMCQCHQGLLRSTSYPPNREQHVLVRLPLSRGRNAGSVHSGPWMCRCSGVGRGTVCAGWLEQSGGGDVASVGFCGGVLQFNVCSKLRFSSTIGATNWNIQHSKCKRGLVLRLHIGAVDVTEHVVPACAEMSSAEGW